MEFTPTPLLKDRGYGKFKKLSTMKFQHKLYIALIIFSFLGTSTLFAQNEISILPVNKWAVQANFQHQDLIFDIDFGQLAVADEVNVRPRYSLEIQRFFNLKSTKNRFFAVAEIDYFHNLYHDKWIGLKLGLGREWQIGNFFIAPRLLGGLARTQGADIQYIYENEKWVVSQEPRTATTDLLLSPRLDFGYRIIESKNPIDIFVNYQMTLYLSPENDIGLPYHGYGFGFRYGF
jgi:hypothetical protein